jgi:hypothetical protein
MFGAELGDFDGPIAQINYFLLNAFHFIPENQCQFCTFSHFKTGQHDAVFNLFDSKNPVPFRFQF